MNTTSIVAVVDDDYRVLESLESLLESAGYNVYGFASANALLQSRVWRELHLLITDIGMSSIDGFALQRELKRERPDVPAILITGCADLLNRAEAERQSDTPIFFKPFDAAHLLRVVKAQLGH